MSAITISLFLLDGLAVAGMFITQKYKSNKPWALNTLRVHNFCTYKYCMYRITHCFVWTQFY